MRRLRGCRRRPATAATHHDRNGRFRRLAGSGRALHGKEEIIAALSTTVDPPERSFQSHALRQRTSLSAVLSHPGQRAAAVDRVRHGERPLWVGSCAMWQYPSGARNRGELHDHGTCSAQLKHVQESPRFDPTLREGRSTREGLGAAALASAVRISRYRNWREASNITSINDQDRCETCKYYQEKAKPSYSPSPQGVLNGTARQFLGSRTNAPPIFFQFDCRTELGPFRGTSTSLSRALAGRQVFGVLLQPMNGKSGPTGRSVSLLSSSSSEAGCDAAANERTRGGDSEGASVIRTKPQRGWSSRCGATSTMGNALGCVHSW
jgi:hypothetical protein